MQPSAPSRLKIGTDYAEMVIGSLQAGTARYHVNGAPVDLDVTIPDDLAERWYWHGPFLCRVRQPGEVGIAVCADTFGVAGAFTQARELDRLRAEADPQPVQMEMF